MRPRTPPTAGRLAVGYAVLAVASVLIAIPTFRLGADLQPEPAIEGIYDVEEAGCLSRSLALEQSGSFVTAASGGSLRLRSSVLSGDLRCVDGATAPLEARVVGASLRGRLGSGPFEATRLGPLPTEASRCPSGQLSPEQAFGRLMLAIAAVVLVARLMGTAAARIGQPRVMGEVLAGILLGPSFLGALAPCALAYLFPDALVPTEGSTPIGPLSAIANFGLAFYMFLVGLELDPRTLRGRVGQSLLISNASVVVPFAMGIVLALPLFELVGGATVGGDPVAFTPFALFMGVALSITAFPVLARILIERRMLLGPIGALALAAAAIDDVTAWCLLAMATAIATTSGAGAALRTFVLAGVFVAAMALVGRRLLSRLSGVYDEAGHIPAGWIAGILVGVLVSAYLAALIGMAAIFGAFAMGLIMPRRAGLTDDVTRRIETLVSSVLLPLFFVVTGLRTEIGSLNHPALWFITLAVIAVAVAGKFLGAISASRYVGIGLRESIAIGVLMNTRGLTELIVLNVGLDLGVIDPTLFTMLVIMALVTTFMAGPSLTAVDRRGELTVTPGQDLIGSVPSAGLGKTPRAVLVLPLDGRNLDALLALAEPVARSSPLREIILAQVVRPSTLTTLLSVDNRDLSEATRALRTRRDRLAGAGIQARAAAFLSTEPEVDILRLTEDEGVDLVLLDGSRPVLGTVVPRGPVGTVLEGAACDVGVVIVRSGRAPTIDGEHPVVVPFGGTEHDWAALELGGLIADSNDASLRMLGSSRARGGGQRDASLLLARASLVVQRLTGLTADPMLVEPSREGVLQATTGAGLLVLGLSDRWRDEGIGTFRSAIARGSKAPVLFVRRGFRPGALAPRRDFTRFAWSSSGDGDPVDPQRE